MSSGKYEKSKQGMTLSMRTLTIAPVAVVVPPGQVISGITLSRALTAGEYNAFKRISTNSVEGSSAMNCANVESVLIVQ